MARLGKGKSLKNNNLNTYTQALDDGLGFAEIEEIIETPENNEYLASLGLSSKLVEEYPYDVTTVLAYKKIEDNYYVLDKVVYIKNIDEIELTEGQNYTLLFHGGRLDNIQNKEDIDNVYIENKNLDFKPLVHRIDNFVPDGNKTNTLSVKMRYPGTHVTFLFDSTSADNTGEKITYISSSDIPSLKGYRHYLLDNAISFGSTISKRYFKFEGRGKLLVPFILGNTLLRNDLNINLEIKGEDGLYIPFVLKLKYNYKQTFRIKLRRCGAYLGPNKTNWRQFMCHNLGADYSKDPFTPSEDIQGDKYQWGHYYSIIWGEKDVYQSNPVPDWNTEERRDTWNISKNDPCPIGYRVPTKVDWENVLKYNNLTRLGTWSNTYPVRVANAGVMVGERLMLPAAGKRFQDGATYDVNGVKGNAGTMATYWSADPSDTKEMAYALEIRGTASNEVKSIVKHDALPVRCIKE